MAALLKSLIILAIAATCFAQDESEIQVVNEVINADVGGLAIDFAENQPPEFKKSAKQWLNLFIDRIESQPLCGPNAVFSKCPPACGGDGCKQNQIFAACIQKCDEKPRCVCKCGFYREGKICVPKELCSKWDNSVFQAFCATQ